MKMCLFQDSLPHFKCDNVNCSRTFIDAEGNSGFEDFLFHISTCTALASPSTAPSDLSSISAVDPLPIVASAYNQTFVSSSSVSSADSTLVQAGSQVIFFC